MIQGTIIKGIGGFYYVNTKNGVYECRARGIFRKEKTSPVVGDFVWITILDEEKKKGSLDKIEKRKNELIRPKVANVEQVIIVFAAVSPEINLDLLDKFLISAEEQSLDIVICINKIDLDKEKKYEKIAEIYKKVGYDVLCISAAEKIGIDCLKDRLKEKITVFAGPSGVGKSSLINEIAPHLQLKTGEISQKIERGKHTTRHAELIEFSENSFIVDSPGFTSFYLDYIKKEQLQYYFIEFEPFLQECKFTGCSHISEPECGVKNQIGKAIHKSRYDRYVFFYQQLLENERRK